MKNCSVHRFDLLRPSDAYFRPWTWRIFQSTNLSLVHVMACNIFSSKPSPKLIPTHSQCIPREQIVKEFRRKIWIFSSEKMHLKMLSAKCWFNNFSVMIISYFEMYSCVIFWVIFIFGRYRHSNVASTLFKYQPGAPLLTWINFNPVWISNHVPIKQWDEVTYPFPNFNGCTVKVWEWISNFTHTLSRM